MSYFYMLQDPTSICARAQHNGKYVIFVEVRIRWQHHYVRECEQPAGLAEIALISRRAICAGVTRGSPYGCANNINYKFWRWTICNKMK